jgi:hypothetical protein
MGHTPRSGQAVAEGVLTRALLGFGDRPESARMDDTQWCGCREDPAYPAASLLRVLALYLGRRWRWRGTLPGPE